MNEEQIKYVEEQLRAGVGESELKQALQEHGYEEAQISQLYSEARKRVSGVSAAQEVAKNGSPSLPGVGAVLAGSFQFVFSRIDLGGWYLLTLFGGVFGIGIIFAVLGSLSMVVGPAALVAAMVIAIPAFVLFIMLSAGALQYASAHQTKVTFWQGWKYVWQNFWPWTWQSLLVWMILMTAYLIALIPIGIVGGIVVSGLNADPLTMLMLLPFVIAIGSVIASLLSLFFYVHISLHRLVFIHEGVRGMSALVRSRQLVRGHWWGVFGRLLLVMVILMILSIVTQVGVATVTIVSSSAIESLAGGIVSMIVGVVSTIFFMRAIALFYFGLATGAPVYDPAASGSTRTVYSILAWIGGVFLVLIFGGAVVAMTLSFSRTSARFDTPTITPPAIEIDGLPTVPGGTN